MAVDRSLITLDFSRDATLNDFTIETLKDRYQVEGETSPQQAFARAAAAFADDDAHAQRLYDYVSKGWFMFATPLLSNGGLGRGLPISCFLTAVEDSRESISAHYDEVIWLSSEGGGIGSYWPLRGNGEKTSRGSQSTGVIPFMAVDDRLILAVSQGGTRRGSEAVYLDIDHPEIEEFITARKPNGGDQNRKIINLHNAVNITDEFMVAVRDNTDFHLRSPKTREPLKTVKARDLFRLIIETRMQTGEPYIHFVDASNRAMPATQKALGLKVRQSNLCVHPLTEILTRDGHLPIGALEDKEVEVWNGEEFSKVTIRRTSEDAEFVRVWFEDGSSITCTPQHKFYDADGKVVRAGELKRGVRLERQHLPVIGGDTLEEKTRIELNAHDRNSTDEAGARAYAAGWATFAGYEEGNRLTVSAPDRDVVLRRLLKPSVNSAEDPQTGGMTISYEPADVHAGYVPFHLGLHERKLWLAGALDAAGDLMEDEDGHRYVVLGSDDPDMIEEMRRLAIECGMFPRIRLTDTLNAFMLPALHAAALTMDGYLLGQGIDSLLDATYPDDLRQPVVADVDPVAFRSASFCATEPKRNRLTFNGIVTGNCTEIFLGTGRDIFGKKRTAVCCLSSVNAETYPDWKDHPTFIEDLFRMLDNTLQVFIDNAPEGMRDAVYSATRERSVGLGLLGFQSYLQSQMVSMESDRAREINKALFGHLRRKANEASLKLGAERGEAPDMQGTGERFAHKLAVAPNASSSIIIPTPMGSGASPSIEPQRANAFLHKTLSGSFPVRNPYLKRELAKIGMDTPEVWKSIIGNEGSVQHLDVPQEIKDVFKTATEIDQRALVRLAGDRTDDICQGQSLNLFFPHDAEADYIIEAHYEAWDQGCKSLYYLRSTAPKRAENTNDAVERAATPAEEVELTEEERLIALSPTANSDCLACEG